MLLSILSEEQRKRFENELELDFAYSLPGVSRFRANIFMQRGSMGAVFRMIPLRIPTIEDLGLPKVATFLADRPRGLVLVTGPTGSGKSTTLAAMVDHINATRKVHIITLEDPIEFMHQNKLAYVNQREIGEDTHSFGDALEARAAPGPRRHPRRRDARPRDDPGRHHRGRDRPPRPRHAPHDRRSRDGRPHHRRVPAPPAGAGADAAGGRRSKGVLSQVLLQVDRRALAHHGDGDHARRAGDLEPDPRGQDPPDGDSIIQGGAQYGMQTLDQHLKALLNAGKVTWDEAVSKSSEPAGTGAA